MLNTKETKYHTVCQIMKCRKTVGPTLRGLKVQDFAISNAKHNTQQLPNCEKVKGMWDQHFGVSGFRDYKCQTSTRNNPLIAKSERNVGASLRGFVVLEWSS